MITGANEDGQHLRNVNIERDIKVKEWLDFRKVQAGELCEETGNPLNIRRAIEVGHVFKLGTKYSEALGATVLDENGASNACIMGCYGIGVTRTLQAVIEQCHDENGVVWPTSVAPYQVCITALDVEPESEVMKLATRIYDELQAKGVDVILDDRPARPGIKFKDSELVGFPLRIGIGERSLAKGNVELKPRVGEMILCSPDETVGQALGWLEENKVEGPCLCGADLTLADLTWMPTCVFMEFLLPRVFGWADPFGDASPFPRLAAWYRGLLERPAFAETRSEIWNYWVDMEKKGQFEPIVAEITAAPERKWTYP